MSRACATTFEGFRAYEVGVLDFSTALLPFLLFIAFALVERKNDKRMIKRTMLPQAKRAPSDTRWVTPNNASAFLLGF
jgi:hypothetical protein